VAPLRMDLSTAPVKTVFRVYSENALRKKEEIRPDRCVRATGAR
jgi:hypothetical protein